MGLLAHKMKVVLIGADMLFIFLTLSIIGIILIFTDPKEETTRWASYMAFFGASAGLSVFILETLIPYLIHDGWAQSPIINWLHILKTVTSFIALAGLPYAFIIYALASVRYKQLKQRNYIKLVLLIPIIHTLIVTATSEAEGYNFYVFLYWAVPYTVVATVLLIRDQYKEKNPLLRRTKLYTNLLVITPLVSYTFTNYVLRSVHIEDVWRYNIIIVALVFIGFLIFSVKNGVLGVRVTFEKHQDVDQTLRSFRSGSSILNHSIKNEVGKMKLFAERIEALAQESKQTEIVRDAKTIKASSNHLLSMVGRIQNLLKDIDLVEEPIRLSTVINETIDSLHVLIEKKALNITTNYNDDAIILADYMHLKEVFSNIIHNAIEASHEHKSIHIDMTIIKRDIVIAVKDQGVGIPSEQLSCVFNPFFSTKNAPKNYGLGLSYCHKVINKHGGSIQIYSQLYSGTTVFVHIPKHRIVKYQFKNVNQQLQRNKKYYSFSKDRS